MTNTSWTVGNARRLRQIDGHRKSRWHSLFGRHVQGLIQSAYSTAAVDAFKKSMAAGLSQHRSDFPHYQLDGSAQETKS